MNQETRNKKNAKYQQNLQKRYGLTKSSGSHKVAVPKKGLTYSVNFFCVPPQPVRTIRANSRNKY